MRVLLTCARLIFSEKKKLHTAAYEKLLECAERDRFQIHQLTDSPDEADIILFTEIDDLVGYLFDAPLLQHQYIKHYRKKCFLYTSCDKPIPFLPGLYTSIEQEWYNPARASSCHYLSSHITRIPFKPIPHSQRDLLFSFVGSIYTHPVRQEIIKLNHPRALCHDVSQGGKLVWYEQSAKFSKYVADYGLIMSRSQFILCPRGVGVSSIRLFEAMECGGVPVIISDSWVPPRGPAWDTFSIQVPQHRVTAIPQILESYKDRSEEMGKLARQAWQDWFSDEVSFHRMVEWCCDILQNKQMQGFRKYLYLSPQMQQFVRPYHQRIMLRKARNAFLALRNNGREG